MRFCPNLSILWTDLPFVERFGRAAEAGFAGCEFWWPRGEDLDAVGAAIEASGLSVALFNFDAGDMPAGDRGLLSDPERAPAFRENVPVALELARRVGAPRINARRSRARLGGISSRSPRMSVRKPGVRSSAPPKMMAAPS